MKVLHLISGGDTGGAKTHIISLIKALDRIIEPKVICFMEGDFYQDTKAAGIDIEVYSQKNRFDLSVVKKIAGLIEDENYDILHCHGARANFIGMFLKNKIKLPMITTIHSDYKLDFKDNFYKNIVFTSLNTLALKSFDYYIAISDEFKDMLIERGFKKETIYTAYNGIDFHEDINFVAKEEFLNRYNIDHEGKLIVGILARLDQVKDHRTFIKAANLVLKENKDLIFLIAGDGFEEKALREMTEDFGIEDHVYFLNYVKDPYSFFNAIDINMLTSLSESFPYVILEGARMKKTIISTKVGGLEILIEDGYNGYLVDVGDEIGLKDKLNLLVHNRDKIKTMGDKLYLDVKEKFSSTSMAERHVEIYREIIERGEKR